MCEVSFLVFITGCCHDIGRSTPRPLLEKADLVVVFLVENIFGVDL
jgi:hypothetical protein